MPATLTHEELVALPDHVLSGFGLTVVEIRAIKAPPPEDFEACPAWFHLSQRIGWKAEEPIVAICAGWQSGKTVSLPEWLKREIHRRGPGDYGAFSSTFKLLSRKFLPELKKVFEAPGYAKFFAGIQQFVFTDEGNRRIHGPEWNGEPTIIQLGHAENPDSLESATLKAVVWDECGQRLVPKQSFDTVRSRLMVNRGRLCLASKPYEFNWFEKLVNSKDDNVAVISYASWDNPENPQKDDPYWDDIRASMPEWKFEMQYGGVFTMPAGLIYDCFDYELHTVEDFRIDSSFQLLACMDFGKVNTAGLAIAYHPDCSYAIGEYHAGKKREYTEHTQSMNDLTRPMAGGRRYVMGCGGNKHGEDGWREAYRQRGLPLDEPPEPNAEVQIDTVYSLISTGRLKFFRRGSAETIQDLQHYSREVNDEGDVLDTIADDHKWHRLAALRYGGSKIGRPRPGNPASAPRVITAPMPDSARVPITSPLPPATRTTSVASSSARAVMPRQGSPFGR